MTITVNIMSYKYGHLVAHAIESVLAQTKRPDVIRVYDDGVGDCAFIKDKYPEVELIERAKNWGTVRNFNDALMKTTTDRVLFLGGDNYLRPDTLAELSKYPEDIISYDIALFGTEAERWKKKVNVENYQFGYPIWHFKPKPRKAIKNHNFIHGSSFYNVKLAKQFGYLNMGGASEAKQEDWGLFKKMMIDGNASHKHIDQPFLFYRRHKYNSIKC